jgi:hypothetical protein
MSKVDESIKDAEAAKAKQDEQPQQALPPFPLMGVPYATPHAVASGLQRRFSTVAYLPTAHGYLPFAIDIIK